MSKRLLLEQFIINNTDNAYRFAYTYAKNQQLAEDIVSESVIKALNSIDSLRDEKFLKTWFYKIIINTAKTELKKSSRIVYTNELEDRDNQINSHFTENISFEEMIKYLPEKYKEIIVLRFFEDMSIKDISIILDINENTVKSRLYRALDILRQDIKGELCYEQ